MHITRLETVGNKQVRLYLDGEPYCILYLEEKRKARLSQGQELSEDQKRMLDDMLLHRGQMRALALLKHRDRTRHELTTRLKHMELPQEILDQTIAYIDGFHYLDDERFVRNYITEYSVKASRTKIFFGLLEKGIKKEMFERIWEECDIDEAAVLSGAADKLIRQKGPVTQENLRKYAANLIRRGYPSEKVFHELKSRID